MDTEETRLYIAIIIGISVLIVLAGIHLLSILRAQHILKAQERHNARAFISMRDKERGRIAADLHDRMGSSLISAKNELHDLKLKIPEHSAFIENSINAVAESIDIMRKVSYNMVPELLLKFGLEVALSQAIFKDVKMRNLQIDLKFDIPPVCEENSVHVYYIILEILNNTVKYSKASAVSISMKHINQGIELRISDNGVGFDKNILSQIPKGLGMHNIFTRAEILKGSIRIDTKPGRGVTYLIDLPEELIRKKPITETSST